MAVRPETKFRWFDRGAEAARAFFPSFKTATGDELTEPYYVCPLCIRRDEVTGRYSFRMLRRGAVGSGELTSEHVPPESFAGRDLLLTCAECNHRAGAFLDSHARRRENPGDVFAGRPTTPLAVNVTAGGHTLSASFENQEGVLAIKINKEKYQKPGALEGFRAVTQFAAGQPSDINIDFSGDRHSERNARISWLRTAYLAAFACMGYRYIFSPALDPVRRQIADPEAEHIRLWMVTTPGEHDWTERTFVTVRQPESLHGYCARVGRHIIFLPAPWDMDFYDRLAESRDSGDSSVMVNGQSYEWPHEPSFGLPLPQSKPDSEQASEGRPPENAPSDNL
ncbi:MAG: hypothetical protein Q8T13_20085 [Acidobacteriota bacterium]|nr:hypothetical protein [Acidobacteriota bacterium]